MRKTTVTTAMGLSLSLFLGGALAIPLQAQKAGAAKIQNDPLGDAAGGPDATALRLDQDEDALRVELAFDPTGAPGAGWVGFVDLDTDGDPATGQQAAASFLTGREVELGADLTVPLDSFTGTSLAVLAAPDGEQLAAVPARWENDRLIAELPTTLLPSGATSIRAHAVIGTPERVTDLVPDAGYVTTAAVNANAALLDGERFAVEVEWKDYAGATGRGSVAHSSDDSVLFWFFDAANWELLLKVLDGCGVNGHYWIYSAATTDVEYRLTVTDTTTGTVRTYSNSLGERQPFVADTQAFATCP